MSNNSWGSHSRSSHPLTKSVPKQLISSLTTAQKKVVKKMHKKKRRNDENYFL
jgi:hypothetical protein